MMLLLLVLELALILLLLLLLLLQACDEPAMDCIVCLVSFGLDVSGYSRR